MDILTSFTVLALSRRSLSYSDAVPSFMILALLMDMERDGTVSMNADGILIVTDKPKSSPAIMLSEIISAQDSCSVKELLDCLLRQFTYSGLTAIVDSIIGSLEDECKNFSKFKGKIFISNELSHKYYLNFVDSLINSDIQHIGIATSALLYGCRILTKYLDKAEYKSAVSLIKSGVNPDGLPLTSFIINNIDFIRGHVMGIIAN